MKSKKLLKLKIIHKNLFTKKRSQYGGSMKPSSGDNQIVISGIGGETVVDVSVSVPVHEINEILNSQNDNNSLFYNLKKDDLKIDFSKDLFNSLELGTYNDINDFIINTYRNLKPDDWKKSIDSEMAFVFFHGHIKKHPRYGDLCKVPEDTILVFLTPPNKIGYTANSKKNFLNFFKNMNETDFKNLMIYRSLFSSVDNSFRYSFDIKNRLRNINPSCFLNSTWYYPGQPYPNLELSVDEFGNNIFKKDKNTNLTTLNFTNEDLFGKNNIPELLQYYFNGSSKKIIFFSCCRPIFNGDNIEIDKIFKREYLIRNVNLSIEKYISKGIEPKISPNYCGNFTNDLYFISEKQYRLVNANSRYHKDRNENFNINVPMFRKIYDYIDCEKTTKKFNSLNANFYAMYLAFASFHKQILFWRLINRDLNTDNNKDRFSKFCKIYLSKFKKRGKALKYFVDDFNYYFNGNKYIFDFIEYDDVGKTYFIKGSQLLSELGLKNPLNIDIDSLPYTNVFTYPNDSDKDFKKLDSLKRKTVPDEMNIMRNIEIEANDIITGQKIIEKILNLLDIVKFTVNCKGDEIFKFNNKLDGELNRLVINNVSRIDCNCPRLILQNLDITNSNIKNFNIEILNCRIISFLNVSFESTIFLDNRFLNLYYLYFSSTKLNNVLIDNNITSLRIENSNIQFVNEDFYKNVIELGITYCPDYILDLGKLNMVGTIILKNIKIKYDQFNESLNKLVYLKYLSFEDIEFDNDTEINIDNTYVLNRLDTLVLKNIPKLNIKNPPLEFINNFFRNMENLISNIGVIELNSNLRTIINQKNTERQINDYIKYI